MSTNRGGPASASGLVVDMARKVVLDLLVAMAARRDARQMLFVPLRELSLRRNAAAVRQLMCIYYAPARGGGLFGTNWRMKAASLSRAECLSYVQTFCHVGSSHLTLPQSTLLNTHPLDLDPREKKLCNTQDKTLRIVASISRTEPLLPSIHFILPLQGFVALCNEIKLSTPTSIFATAASNRSADNLFVLGVQRRKSRHHGGCFQ